MSRHDLDVQRIERAYELLDEAVARRVIPGGVALVGVGGGWLPPYATGLAVSTPECSIEANADTVYDLASLTKVTAALPSALLLIQDGTVDAQDPIAEVLEEWSGDQSKADITLLHLLTHTSGLPAHRDFYSHGWSRDEILREVLATPLDAQPGTAYVYSDLGYILIGEWVRRVTGETIDAFVLRRLYEPLNMRDTTYLPPAEWQQRIAASEYREHLGRHQWGEVNDDNASALGGVSGHAGLFGTAGDLARYVDSCWLPWQPAPNGPLTPAVSAAALQNHAAELGAHRGLGWVLHGDVWDPSGLLMSPSSFGHTGYTGTSIWIDPARQLKIILLTNRVHSGLGRGIIGLRRRFHNAVAACCTGAVVTA